MKALIMFDGSKSSIKSLQVACQDAHREETKRNTLVVAAFGCVPYGKELKAGLLEFEEQADNLFFQASKFLQGGEFSKVTGEIILCRENRVTEIVAEYFNESQMDRIYLPAPTTYSSPELPHKNHKKLFARIFNKSSHLESQPVTLPEGKPLAELVYPGVLVNTISGKVILTDATGIITRLSSMNNLNKTDNAQAAVLSQGYIEVRPGLPENVRLKSLAFANYLN